MKIRSLIFSSPFLLILFFSTAIRLGAALSLSPVFGDHMVLQRDQPITVWGTAAAGAEVAVSIGGEHASVKADESGKWLATLEALKASGPFELSVSSGTEKDNAKDIMIGDVWIAAGQSNMVFALQSTTEWPQVRAAGDFPAIRICKLPGDFSFTPMDKYSREVRWEPLNSAKAGYFSAVGYHFARTLQPAIGVTVGIVQASVGGTQVEQWTPEAALKAAQPDSPLFAEKEKAQAALAAGSSTKIGPMQSGASVLYNGLIHPMRYTKFAGVVWYQGEANTRSKRDYRPVLKTMIQSWREVFAQPELPFVLVQLPNFGLPKEDGWMRVQEAQLITAHDLGLGLVVTIDQGSAATIHPPNKAEVGRRAGLAALQTVYKQDVEGTSPVPKSIIINGDTVTVEFEGFKGDLVLKGDAVKGFELAGVDGNFQAATAEIQGRSVVVKATIVTQPKQIRYLWANSPEAVTLFSAAGLPATPFRSVDANGAPLWFAAPAK
jgi:sialate O-acetylesterase